MAKDEMFTYTDTKISPWWVVDADDKKRAHLNCISHLLSMIPYQELDYGIWSCLQEKCIGYVRTPKVLQTFFAGKVLS